MSYKAKEIRLDLEELEGILQKAGKISEKGHLNDAHIEPGELVLRVLEDVTVKEGDRCPECGDGTIQPLQIIPHEDSPTRFECDSCGAEWNLKGKRVPCQTATSGY